MTSTHPIPPRPMRRRRLLLAAGAGLASATLGPARAQTAWPSRPLRMVVAFPAGGLADVMMRILEPQLTEALVSRS